MYRGPISVKLDQAEYLIRALLDPASALSLSAREWNDLMLMGRKTGLLARLGAEIIDGGLFDKVPQKARAHLYAACIAAESTQTAIRFEINRVLRALSSVETPIILLKGAAYLMVGLPPARGRMLGDLDIMVPHDKIEEVEQTLIEHGWESAEMEEYDQKFYRNWMHEVPPLQHPKRDTPVDLHHTIAPRTSRVSPDAAALFAASVPVEGTRLRTLAPADMVLHSAIHLFNDEVGKRLRDLFDLHELLCCFAGRPGFWDELLSRAQLHHAGRPAYYCLRYAQRIFDTAVPEGVQTTASRWAPRGLRRKLMDWLFTTTFDVRSLTKPRSEHEVAHWLLYVRSHWLRMPPHLLLRHLAIKATRRTRERWSRKRPSR